MSDEDKAINWFEENYKGLIFGVIAGLIILFSYKSFLSSVNQTQLDLSRQYDLAVEKYLDGSKTEILNFSETHMQKNSDNIYTSLANLYSAKIMYDNNNIKESYMFLNHVIDNSPDKEIADLAKYRKAKLLIEEKKYDMAHTLIGVDSDNYQHIELKGDIFYLENKRNDAIQEYNKVLTYSITPNERKNIKAKINFIK